MKTRQVNISKKKYWYVDDTVYINRGVSKPVTRSLGPVDTTTKEALKHKQAEFAKGMIDAEAIERTNYWHTKTINKEFDHKTVVKLEQLRSRLYRGKRDLGHIAQSAMEMAFLTDFIYNSNKIEGSRLPQEEVRRLVEQSDPKKNDEVSNTIKAIAYISDEFSFTIKSLVKAHSILLAHEPDKHGLRKTDIIVGDDQTLCLPEHIESQLKKLFGWYDEQKYIIYPPELAFHFYYRFERIHPFMDGNGRLGRLLMNHILKESRYHPVIIWDGNRVSHFNAFKRAAKDDYMDPFFNFMIDQYVVTYEAYADKVSPAETFQDLVTYFMTPTK